MADRIITEEELGQINSCIAVIAEQRLAIIAALKEHVVATVKLRESNRNLEMIYDKLCDVCSVVEKRRIQLDESPTNLHRRLGDAPAIQKRPENT